MNEWWDRSGLLKEALRTVNEVYERSAVGCCMHIVMDDGNIRDGDVEFCADYAKKNNCHGCMVAAAAFASLFMFERARVLNMGLCFEHGFRSHPGECGYQIGKTQHCQSEAAALVPVR